MNHRAIIEALPDAEIEQMLILRAVAQPLSTPLRAVLMQALGITPQAPSHDAGKPFQGALLTPRPDAYPERAEADFTGPAELMGR